MDYGAGLIDADRWQWLIEHAGAVLFILVCSTALTTSVVWVALGVRYRRIVRTQGRRLREFEKAFDGASPEEARRQIDSLRARVTRLEPRRLTGRQKAVLKKLLVLPESAGVTEINVSHDVACSDAKHYAEDFTKILGSCQGWQPSNATRFGFDHSAGAGLAILCCREGRTVAGARFMSNALAKAGIEHETIQSPVEQLELVVSSRAFADEQHADRSS